MAARCLRALRTAAGGVVAIATAVAADDSKIIFPGGSQHPAAPAAASGGTANSVALVVALLIAAVGGWYYWRNRRTTGGVPRDGRALSIDETRSLGNRQYLVVASYEGRKFLLGVCPGRIDMLAPLNAPRGDEETSR